MLSISTSSRNVVEEIVGDESPLNGQARDEKVVSNGGETIPVVESVTGVVGV